MSDRGPDEGRCCPRDHSDGVTRYHCTNCHNDLSVALRDRPCAAPAVLALCDEWERADGRRSSQGLINRVRAALSEPSGEHREAEDRQ